MPFSEPVVLLCCCSLTESEVVDVGGFSRVFGRRGGATNSGGMAAGNRLVIAVGRLPGLAGGLLDCCISSGLIRLFLACCCQKSDCCICAYEVAAANR